MRVLLALAAVMAVIASACAKEKPEFDNMFSFMDQASLRIRLPFCQN